MATAPFTITTLGQKIKEKYPGQYGDLADEEVGRRIKAKFPGSYEDFTDDQPGTQPQGSPSFLNRAVGAAREWLPSGPAPDWPELGPKFREQLSGVAHGIADIPIQVFSSLGKTGEAILKRDVGEAAYQFAGIFPPAQQIGKELGEGQYAEALGHSAALAAPFVPKVAGAAAGAVGKALKVDPVVAAVKALRPAPAASNFAELFETARQDIAANGAITNVDSLIKAARTAKAELQTGLDKWMRLARTAGITVDGSPIAQAAIDAIPETMRLENPTAAAALEAQVRTMYGRSFTVDRLRQLLKERNADLDAFYTKAEGKQQAAITSGKTQAIVKAERDQIASSFYRALDPGNAGAGPAELQARTGAVTEVLDAAQKRRNASIAERAVSPASATGKAIREAASIPGKIATGRIEDINFGGQTDRLLRQAFSDVGPRRPLPAPPMLLPGAGRPQFQLAPPALRTPPPPDVSGLQVTTGPLIPVYDRNTGQIVSWTHDPRVRGQVSTTRKITPPPAARP